MFIRVKEELRLANVIGEERCKSARKQRAKVMIEEEFLDHPSFCSFKEKEVCGESALSSVQHWGRPFTVGDRIGIARKN